MNLRDLLAAAAGAALLAAAPALAQDGEATEAAAEPAAEEEAAAPAADPADVESIDAIMAAVYDVISGPAGEARDWDRFRSLFAPNARLVAIGSNQEGERVFGLNGTPEDYISSSGQFLETNGFEEREIGRTTDRFGDVVQIFSAYEGVFRPGQEDEATIRGINSFQLARLQDRWWVVTIFWQGETDEVKIPEEMIGAFE
jgi:hypothetical protein